MKFLWTTLAVSDMDRSLKFYQSVLGLPVIRRMDPPGMRLVFLGDGDTQIELIETAGAPKASLKSPVTIGFQVDDLEAAMAMVKKHEIAVESGPFAPNPTIKFFYVRDPDGMHIQFVQQTR